MTIIDYESAKMRFKNIDKTADERINLYINNDPDGESAFNDFLNSQTEGGSLYEMNFLLNEINNAKNSINESIMNTMQNKYANLNTSEGKEEINNLLSHDEIMQKFSKFSKELQVSEPLMNVEKSKNIRNKVKFGVYLTGVFGLCFFIAVKLLNIGNINDTNNEFKINNKDYLYNKKELNDSNDSKALNYTDSTALFKKLISND